MDTMQSSARVKTEPNGAGDGVEGAVAQVDVAIVGSGFSGLAMAVGLKRAGHRDFAVLERAQRVGGTWRENTYPGCRCDVPSHVYSFSFAPNPDWQSTFSRQAEIQAYLERVAAEQGLLERIRFGCEVEEATWDAAARRWRLRTSHGPLSARVLIAGAGPLHEPSIPAIPGLDEFDGAVFHSASWDHSHDLAGERVAVVGTGASAIQFVPQIQPVVERLHLYQRTPPWVMPLANRPLTRVERLVYRRVPAAQRLMRSAIYWAREAFAIPMLRVAIAPLLKRIAKRHLRREVPDPQLRAKLTPDYLPGCKRILISDDYLPAVAQPNVEVIAGGVAEVHGRTVVSEDGSEREVDTIILATGFHVTDLPVAERIRDGEGRSLSELWDGSPQAHRGTTVAGYPNLFFLLGPNTGLGHNSVVFMAEAQVAYVLGALAHMRARGIEAIEPRDDVQRAWNAEIQRRMKGTVWTEGGCSSWYIDRNGLNTTLWPDFSYRFRRVLRRFDPAEHVAIGAPGPGSPAPEPRAPEPSRVSA